MAMSTIYVWILLGCDLGICYFMACKLSQQRLQKWFRKGMEQEPELEVQRIFVFFFPLALVFMVFLMAGILIANAQILCEDLPNKITGNWSVCEGTILEWHRGYRGQKGAAMIQVGDVIKGYDIRNLTIQEGEMVGVTVRMAYNRDTACILEYKESGTWVREMYLSNFGREVNAVSKTIVMNILAGIASCGFILKKILRPERPSAGKAKIFRNGFGICLIILTLINEILLCRAVLEFQQTWQGEQQMVSIQFFMILLIYANILFCILVTPKATGYRYWWTSAKAFFKTLDEQQKR